MKVILLADVKKVGKKQDTVDVKDGYGTFLINSGKALLASNKALDIVNKQKAEQKAQYDLDVAKAKALKEQIEKLVLNFSLKTNNGQVFGSISSKNVLEELEKQHQIKLDKFMLVDGNKTYTLGGSRVPVRLHKEVIAYITIRVTGE